MLAQKQLQIVLGEIKMIHALIGEIIYVRSDEVVIRTNESIEFSVTISGQTASRLSQLTSEAKREIRLLTYLQHRDDGMTLYGFGDEEERLLFTELIKVNGIGPRQAIKILGSVQVRAFIRALDDGDLQFLATIPGIGPKTSQKLVLALRGSVALDFPSQVSSSSGSLDRRYNDLVAALSDMGYDKRQVVSVISELLTEFKNELEGRSLHDTEQFLFKNAIVRLT